MGYAEQAVLAQNPDFLAKVKMAVIITALKVKGEVRTRGFKYYFEKRGVLADVILGAPMPVGVVQSPLVIGGVDSVVQRFSWAVCADQFMVLEKADWELANSIEAVWDDLAGVEEDERPDPA